MRTNLNRQFVSWELILVNDGSTDNGPELLTAALHSMGESRVRLISYPVNYGRGRALRTGIEHARGDVIVTTEADCSWGDDIVKRLVDALQFNAECDFVVASPHAEGGKFIGVPNLRLLLTKWGNRLISLFFRTDLTMHTGMTRAYRRDVIVPLRTHENDKEFHLEVLWKLITLKFRYSEIPAVLSWELRNKAPSRPKSPVLNAKILKIIRTHFVFLFLADPMRLFFNAAVLTFLVSLLFFALAAYHFIIAAVAVYFAMMAMFFLLFGFMFIGLAVVLSRLRDQSVEIWIRDYPIWPPMRSRPQEVVIQSAKPEA